LPERNAMTAPVPPRPRVVVRIDASARAGHPAPSARPSATFPLSAGILLGLGMGGFFDGIVLHQILQWHHMLTTAGFPADSVANLRVNTLWDGIFHATTYVFVAAGLVVLWRAAHRPHATWSYRLLAGTMLIGFGAFNVVEGIVNHHLLQLHHVNETVAREHWIWWDLGFLAWGALMLVGGYALVRSGRRRSAAEADPGR
jgi:uncharacterized membrane protein